eukprot:2099298-Pyramimonas_sp.AAC.1
MGSGVEKISSPSGWSNSESHSSAAMASGRYATTGSARSSFGLTHELRRWRTMKSRIAAFAPRLSAQCVPNAKLQIAIAEAPRKSSSRRCSATSPCWPALPLMSEAARGCRRSGVVLRPRVARATSLTEGERARPRSPPSGRRRRRGALAMNGQGEKRGAQMLWKFDCVPVLLAVERLDVRRPESTGAQIVDADARRRTSPKPSFMSSIDASPNAVPHRHYHHYHGQPPSPPPP